MKIITQLKITFVITFLSGLIYWSLLNCSIEGISSFEFVPENFLLTLGKIQLLENQIDVKLAPNQSPIGLSVGLEMLTQGRKY